MAELHISFAQWSQQARLVHALEQLARGEPVATVADALGYATPSNFIAMFRRSFGDSPRRYFAASASIVVPETPKTQYSCG
jgi:AraC-like DNA-binding protein